MTDSVTLLCDRCGNSYRTCVANDSSLCLSCAVANRSVEARRAWGRPCTAAEIQAAADIVADAAGRGHLHLVRDTDLVAEHFRESERRRRRKNARISATMKARAARLASVTAALQVDK